MSLLKLLRHPQQGLRAQALLVALLSLVALLLRLVLDLDGVRDVDTLNFGLAAYDWNPVEQRPHPPGYPGYVLYLKLLIWLGAVLPPDELAKWGSRLLGTACVPAAWWVAHRLLRLEAASVRLRGIASAGALEERSIPALRPMASAALVVAHPILWYYGSDGQSHSSEALASLLLLGLAAGSRPQRSWIAPVLLAFAFGLSGSLRPTIAALNAPVLIWAFWRRRPGTWLAGAAAGALGVLVWLLPTIQLAGGYELYSRTNEALVGHLFLRNFSLMGSGADSVFRMVNWNIALWGALLALLLLPGWNIVRAGRTGWGRALAATAGLSVAFYTVVYCAESGYFAGLAALSVLAPASWRQDDPRLRMGASLGAIAALLGASFVLFGPAETRMYGVPGNQGLAQPTFSNVLRWDQIATDFRSATCGVETAFDQVLLTDAPYGELQRDVSLRCGLIVVRWLRPSEIDESADGLLVYRGSRLLAIPGPIPFETSGPGAYRPDRPVDTVMLAPTASEALERLLRSQERCPPAAGHPPGDAPFGAQALTWSQHCLPEIQLGSQEITFPGRGRPPRPGQSHH